jgi:hypothetical protein
LGSGVKKGFYLLNTLKLFPGCRHLRRVRIKKSCLLGAVFLWTLVHATPVRAADKPFDNPANWGGTGLMEIPSARVLEDGEFRIGAAQAWPYRWFTGAMGVFPGLELSGRLTEICNIASGLGEDYGANKDKAFDLKYQLFAESKYYPALALGLHDFHGTKLFSLCLIPWSAPCVLP